MRRISAIIILLSASCSLLAQPLRRLVGTYTEGTASQGVYLYEFDSITADTNFLSEAPSGNPSFVIPAPYGVYSVSEFSDGRQGVSSYAINDDTITLRQSFPIPTGGEDPCNLLLTNQSLISSNYTGGTLTSFRLTNQGDIKSIAAIYGRKGAHMHCAVLSPDGKYIFAANLGNDCIHRFNNDPTLAETQVAWQHKGRETFGPRHMIFSSDGRFAYLLCELGDKLVVFKYGKNGKLTPIQTLTAYPGEGHGSADLHLSPDGRFLYTSHRLKQDGIAVFSVNPKTGRVKPQSFQATGIHPRNFAISPDGSYLLCACRDSGCIQIYSIDKDSGALAATGKSIQVGAPVCVQFIP